MDNPYTLNTSVLAFVGDGAYELYVRSLVIESGGHDPGVLHKICTEYVRAESQALAMKALMKLAAEGASDGASFLTEEELKLVKRARNHKMPNRSRSADPVEYKLATALEALIGCHYVSGNHERMNEIIEKAIEIIDGARETK